MLRAALVFFVLMYTPSLAAQYFGMCENYKPTVNELKEIISNDKLKIPNSAMLSSACYETELKRIDKTTISSIRHSYYSFVWPTTLMIHNVRFFEGGYCSRVDKESTKCKKSGHFISWNGKYVIFDDKIEPVELVQLLDFMEPVFGTDSQMSYIGRGYISHYRQWQLGKRVYFIGIHDSKGEHMYKIERMCEEISQCTWKIRDSKIRH